MKPHLNRLFLFPAFLLFFTLSYAQITLSHNINNVLLPVTSVYGCSGGGLKWARTFTLEDFGISPDKDFVINSGDMGIYAISSLETNIKFNIYSIDQNFPDTFENATLLGSSQIQKVIYFGSSSPTIKTVMFNTPVVIHAGIETILVEVEQVEMSENNYSAIMAALTIEDSFNSWFKSVYHGCNPLTYTDIRDLEIDVPDGSLYITVTGTQEEPSLSFGNFSHDKVTIYPNPAKSILNIDGGMFESYLFTNMLGQKVLQGSLKPSQSAISIEDIDKGIYLLSLKDRTNTTVIKKIIKE